MAKTIPKVHHLDRWAAELGDSIAAGDPDCLLRTEDIAKVMRVSEAWLEIGRSKGWGPPYIRLSPRLIRYKRSDVVAYLRSRALEQQPGRKRRAA